MIRAILTSLLTIAATGIAQDVVLESQLRRLPSPDDKALLTPFELPARYVLKGATVHTVSGNVIENGRILVVDGIIEEVGTDIDASVQTEIDLTGFHLYPGLISAASPLGLLEIGAVRASRDYSEVGTYTPDIESWLAVNPDSELVPVARAGGLAYSLVVPRGGIIAGQSVGPTRRLGHGGDGLRQTGGAASLLTRPIEHDPRNGCPIPRAGNPVRTNTRISSEDRRGHRVYRRCTGLQESQGREEQPRLHRSAGMGGNAAISTARSRCSYTPTICDRSRRPSTGRTPTS